MKKKFLNNLFLFVPLLILNTISLLNMINAKLISNTYNNAFFKQLVWFSLGYIIIIIMSKIKVKKIFKYSSYLYIFSCFLLVLVLFIGNDINGAKCWLSIFNFSFQPSELVKITLILFLINVYSNSKIKSHKDEFILILKYFIITFIPSLLVFLEPDTGAIINYLIIFVVILFSSKLNKWWYISLFSISTLCISTFFLMFFFFQDTLINLIGSSIFYRMDRIINFTGGIGYQLENALITIGSASFLGTGLNKILLYIPEAPTDFIFAFSIGNFGILSAILILLCYLTITIFLLFKASNSKQIDTKIFINSFLGIFLFHIVYNISMNVGLLPIMGIPLPFLSYGGTNTFINYIFIGFIINLCKEKVLK